MPRRFYSSTAAQTTLSAGCTNVATTMVITAATNLPATPFTILVDPDTVNEEVVEVTNRSGTTLTVTRGVDGTTGVAHSSGAVVKHGVSARDFDEPNAFINGTSVVTTTHIANNAVTNAKLADSSITLNGTSVSLGGSATIPTGSAIAEPFFFTS